MTAAEGTTRLDCVAVLGSGTMGAGIAQAGLGAGYEVVLYDLSDDLLDRARERIASGLAKQGLADTAERLQCSTTLERVADAHLVIEAVPEQLELKADLFARVEALCSATCVLASNTSSLPIAAIASGCRKPQRVAGLHFFNPVHRMALVEVVRTAQTDQATVDTLLRFAERLGKTPVVVRDTPGFVVNRVARPFYGEALRLLGEGIASHEEIDAALHLAGGFPLGPFALMDLIGIDVNFAVTCSMYEQSFGEPRYRPHPIQQQMVYQGRLGRKTGWGFYHYPQPQAAPTQPASGSLSDRILIGSGSWAPGLEICCMAALLEVVYEPADDLLAALVVAGAAEGAAEQVIALDRELAPDVPLFAQCADVCASTLTMRLAHPERLVGFDGLFMDGAMTLVATPGLSADTRRLAETFAQRMGCRPIWAADTPALIVPRVVAMLANEAAFAVGEGVADPDTIDTAMRLGANHPSGPLERAAALGYDQVTRLLDHLQAEYGEERYRVAPVLRRAARLGILER